MKLNFKILTLVSLSFWILSGCSESLKNTEEAHSLVEVADTNVVIPPAWAFGILYGAYTNQEQSVELIDKIIEHDYPIDAFWIDSWFWDWQNQGQGPKKYIDFIADTVSYPDMKEMWNYMQSKNIKAGIWMWDAIMKTGNETEYDDFESKGFFKSENIRADGWHNGLRTTIIGDNSEKVQGTWCGDIDFENPAATAYFQQKVKHFFDDGVDFIKLDKTDAIPVCKAMFETTQKLGKETKGRGFILSHSGGVDSPGYKRYPGKWTDDTRSDWTVEKPTHEFSPWLPKVAFKENLAMYTDTTRHFYKIPFMANDMGGFAVGLDGKVDEELYIRWLESAHFVPLTTPFSQPENLTGNIPFNVSEQADSIFRFYSHLKMELFPYIYSYAHKARLERINIIRPTRLYEYLFGEEMLVAPVYEQGKRERNLFLPEGSKWTNYWTGITLEGGQPVSVEAPLDRIPIFIKEGAIIPKREYARSIESGTNDLLTLEIFSGANGTFSLIEDDGTSYDYLDGKYAVTNIEYLADTSGSKIIIHPVEGNFQGMNDTRSWKFIIRGDNKIREILHNGENVEFEINQASIQFELPLISKRKKIEIVFSREQ